MSFTITFQNNKNPLNKVEKNPQDLFTATGTLRNESWIVNPEILVEWSGNGITQANYMSIPEFGRKYFIEDIESVRTGLWIVRGHCDVLNTYKAALSTNMAVILRQENDFDLLLNDGVFKCKQNPRVFHREFPSGLGQFNFILITQGGD